MNTFFLTVLLCIYSINAVTEEAKTCNAVEMVADAVCESVHSLFEQDNEQLSIYLCNCTRALLKTNNFGICKVHKHDFPDAPKCGKLLKSEVFKEFADDENLVSNFVKGLSKGQLNVCDDKKHDEIVELVNSILTTKSLRKQLDKIIKLKLQSTEEATLVTDCYHELLKLGPKN